MALYLVLAPDWEKAATMMYHEQPPHLLKISKIAHFDYTHEKLVNILATRGYTKLDTIYGGFEFNASPELFQKMYSLEFPKSETTELNLDEASKSRFYIIQAFYNLSLTEKVNWTSSFFRRKNQIGTKEFLELTKDLFEKCERRFDLVNAEMRKRDFESISFSRFALERYEVD